jgi:ParB family transcriptional regulator, chromosome partitioning protein
MSADSTKKRGLGRGLDALFRDVKKEEQTFQTRGKQETTAAPVNETRIKRAEEIVSTAAQKEQPPAGPPRKLPVDRMTPGKYQPRRHFDDAAIDQLADSIAVHGILQPLLVRPLSGTMYEIVAGERRWRAAQKAQLHELPVVIRDLTDKEAMEIALIENLQREDLSAVEEAEGYQRLMEEFGHTQDMLSQQLGKSRSHIANTLRLLKLPASVRQMVQAGTLSAGHARTLVNAKNPEELAASIVKRGLSVRQTEKLVKQLDAGKPKPKSMQTKGFAQKDVDILALEQKITSLMGMRVTIDNNGTAGRLIVDYKTLEQLDDIIARLSQTPRRG